MKKPQSNSVFVNSILHILGLAVCILPPAICTLMYFPLWKSVGAGSVIAGGVALVLVMCASPLFKFMKERIHSPASYVMWLIAFLLFFFVAKIAEEMTVICFVGFVSNAIGAIIFKLSEGGDANKRKV